MQIAPTASDLIGRPPVAETPSGGGRFLPKDRDRRRGLCRSRHLENPPAPPTVTQYKVARFDDPADRAKLRRPKRSTRSLVRAFASSGARASHSAPADAGSHVAPASGRRGGATEDDEPEGASPRCDPPGEAGESVGSSPDFLLVPAARLLPSLTTGPRGRSPGSGSSGRSRPRAIAVEGRLRRVLRRTLRARAVPTRAARCGRYAAGGGGRSRIAHGITTPQSPQ